MKEKYQEALKRGQLSIGVIEKALALEDDNEIEQALDYAILYKYTISEMENYVKNRKEELAQYQEWIEKMGVQEYSKPPTNPDYAYLTKCSGCLEEVDSRTVRGGILCPVCLYELSYIRETLGAGKDALETLKKLLDEYKERKLYEELKRKFEGGQSKGEEKKLEQSQSPPGFIK